METDATRYTKLVFWLKLMLGLSAGLLFLVIFVFAYSNKVDPSFKVMGLAGSKMLAVFDSLGLDTMAEAFADRTYESDGTLRNRKYDNALITDPKKAKLQTAQMMGGYVVAVDGVEIDIQAQTLCIHSDTPNAVAIAEAVRKTIL